MAAPAEAEACRQQLALSERGLLLLGNSMAVLGRSEAVVGPTAALLHISTQSPTCSITVK